MKTSATNRRIRVLMTGIRDKSLLPRPEFQRRLVWTNRHKELFLQTVLLNFPFPEIYIAAGEVDPETGEGTEMLVDGQQRLTTLYQYFTGATDLAFREIRPYSQLSKDEKVAFLEYEVVVRDLGSKSIEEIKEVFQRINSTKYSLNAMEIHNARFDGALKNFAEDLARHQFFEDNNVFRPQDVRRMGDIVFALTITISLLTGYFNRDDLLEEFLSRYNDEFPAEVYVRDELNQVFSLITSMEFDPKSRAWRKADLLTLIVELHHAMFREKMKINRKSLETALKDFYTMIDEVRENTLEETAPVPRDAVTYYKAALQATNDRGNRIRRSDVLKDVILTAM